MALLIQCAALLYQGVLTLTLTKAIRCFPRRTAPSASGRLHDIFPMSWMKSWENIQICTAGRSGFTWTAGLFSDLNGVFLWNMQLIYASGCLPVNLLNTKFFVFFTDLTLVMHFLFFFCCCVGLKKYRNWHENVHVWVHFVCSESCQILQILKIIELFSDWGKLKNKAVNSLFIPINPHSI